ncbi:MAG: hypothetical protein BGO01_13345 [Armatimonadetes bacterium 55-13]|nr:hypothetical protein [Armatimonadota bacterium]OJU61895.1 MAG: hypothetical protein BGO01_13345 [Armatimonadetes bacterium 55-13]
MELILFYTEEELETLLTRFESAAIPRPEWLHREHLAVATLFLLGGRTLDDIRTGIQRLNEANGVETTPMMGYHESITRFWAHMIQHRLNSAPTLSRLQAVNDVLTAFADKGFIFQYYTYDRITSVEARYGWVTPDLQPLP